MPISYPSPNSFDILFSVMCFIVGIISLGAAMRVLLAMSAAIGGGDLFSAGTYRDQLVAILHSSG